MVCIEIVYTACGNFGPDAGYYIAYSVESDVTPVSTEGLGFQYIELRFV